MATETQTRASAPDGMPYELFVYLIYDETKFTASGPGKITFEGDTYPAQYLPTADKTVGWYLDANYKYPATTTNISGYILGENVGNNYIFGGINLYGKLEEKQVRFKEGKYQAAKFENGNSVQTPHHPGTIFMAPIGDEGSVKTKAHLIYDDGTYFLDVIPRMLPLLNGGTGADLSVAPVNSIIYTETSGTSMGSIATASGALYATSTNGKPKFGTLPIKQGGTGAKTFTKYGIIYGNSTSALKATAAGELGALLVGGGADAAPKFVAPAVNWVAGSTAGPVFKLTIDTTDYTATIPSASNTASGIVTTEAQTFKGIKTFSSGIVVNGITTFNEKVNIIGTDDAYYNSSSDNKTGALNVTGGITASMNMRVDGGTIQFKKAAKVQYNDTKKCFNFIFN